MPSEKALIYYCIVCSSLFYVLITVLFSYFLLFSSILSVSFSPFPFLCLKSEKHETCFV
jgi:hypothetical protein